MTNLTPIKPTLSGTDPAGYATCQAGGDTFDANPSTKYLIHVKNGHSASQSVVIDDPNTPSPAGATTFNPDVTDPVPNAGERFIKVDDPGRFRDPNTGRISLSYSGTTLLTLKILDVG